MCDMCSQTSSKKNRKNWGGGEETSECTLFCASTDTLPLFEWNGPPKTVRNSTGNVGDAELWRNVKTGDEKWEEDWEDTHILLELAAVWGNSNFLKFIYIFKQNCNKKYRRRKIYLKKPKAKKKFFEIFFWLKNFLKLNFSIIFTNFTVSFYNIWVKLKILHKLHNKMSKNLKN